MPQPRRGAGFAQKTKSCRLVTEIFLADDFQCHGAVEIDVERLVSDPHRTATQLDRFPVLARHQLIVLKSLHRLPQCGLDRTLGRRRLAGLNSASEPLAKHADRTEFHCSRKLVAAARAGSLGLHAHGPNRPSAAIRKQPPRSTERRESASTAPAKLLSRSTNDCVFLYTSASNHVSEQNSGRCDPAPPPVDNAMEFSLSCKDGCRNRALAERATFMEHPLMVVNGTKGLCPKGAAGAQPRRRKSEAFRAI